MYTQCTSLTISWKIPKIANLGRSFFSSEDTTCKHTQWCHTCRWLSIHLFRYMYIQESTDTLRVFSSLGWRWRLEHSVETSAKISSELKLVTDNLSLYLCSSQLRSHWKLFSSHSWHHIRRSSNLVNTQIYSCIMHMNLLSQTAAIKCWHANMSCTCRGRGNFA